MLKIVTASRIKEIDKYCIEVLKIPGIVLMENAALKVLKNIDIKLSSFVIVCGSGNNGGDGFAVARHLYILNKKIEVFFLGQENHMSEDCKINYNILRALGLKINKVSNLEDMSSFKEAIEGSDLTIDAIFGTGLLRNVEDIYDLAISIINENSKYTLAIDVPSGLESDTGKILGNAVRANKTISFTAFKRGFFTYGTQRYLGEIIVEDIGIPNFVIDKFYDREFIIEENTIKEKLQVRDKYSHKGDFGRVLVIAGSSGFTGAAYLSTEAAVKSGAGLVTLCCPGEVQSILSSKLVEAMTISLEEKETLKALVDKCNVIAVGPGMGSSKATLEVVKYILKNARCPVVLDADGISVLKDNLLLLKDKGCEVVITPHHGEMARITGLPLEHILEKRLQTAKEFAAEYGVTVLLKGYNTIVSDGVTTFVNSTGSSAMASGGMGDALTGIISAFIAQKYSPLEAACIGSYIHGYCGDRLAENMFSVNAGQLVEKLPYIIKELCR